MSEFFLQHADASQIILFASVISTLWAAERCFVAKPDDQKLRHSLVNVLFALTALPVELGLSVVCLAVSNWCMHHGSGLVTLLPDHAWLRGAVAFVALDLLDYVYHRLMHHLPWLWRFHRVHHTDQAVDASTSIREHPGESLVRSGFLVVWTFALGASFETLLVRQAAETTSAILAHSAMRLPPRVAHLLGLVFITPNLHHVHHHYVLPYTDRNFGGVFSVWDRLFGTYAELGEAATIFGLDTHMDADDHARFPSLMAMPFRGDDDIVLPLDQPGAAALVPKIG